MSILPYLASRHCVITSESDNLECDVVSLHLPINFPDCPDLPGCLVNCKQTSFFSSLTITTNNVKPGIFIRDSKWNRADQSSRGTVFFYGWPVKLSCKTWSRFFPAGHNNNCGCCGSTYGWYGIVRNNDRNSDDVRIFCVTTKNDLSGILEKELSRF